jgi:hypothetical protein
VLHRKTQEESFRRGYERAAIDTFHAIERFLDPSTREVLRTWIEKDIYVWRLNAMLGYPPIWRVKMLAAPKLRTLNDAAGISIPGPPES